MDAAPPPSALPPGWRLVADVRTRVHRGGLATGGSPWGVVKLGPVAARLLHRSLRAGPAGAVAADRLLDRGLVHPVVPRRTSGRRRAACVVVPAYGRADLLDRCLASLALDGPDDPAVPGCPDHGAGSCGRLDVLVVDDASPTDEVSQVAAARGTRWVRHAHNRGPGAARNTGRDATQAPVLAFLDADCVVTPGWLDALLPLFDDPRVGAVAPRVIPRPIADDRLLTRYEHTRSALDMGPHPALVRPGAALAFLPSACLLVRREALAGHGFDEALRLGEDVDLVWRLAAAGWHVRYEPAVTVEHELRPTWHGWAARRFDYGTSAAELDRRHPGRLAPARVSAWNLAALAALAAARPLTAAVTTGAASALLARHLRRTGVRPGLALRIAGQGVAADAATIARLLRREWWPLGLAALVAVGRGRPGRAARWAAAGVLGVTWLEWCRTRPDVDLATYTLVRLADDASYGSGVIAGAVRGRRPQVLLPRVRLPWVGRTAHLPARPDAAARPDPPARGACG